MEGVIIFVAIVVGWIVLRLLLRALGVTIGAAARAATGQGSFGENVAAGFKGMGSFEARLADDTLTDEPDSPTMKAVEVKGLFPVRHTGDAKLVISVLDTTDGDPKPVLAALDQFQEDDTVAYQFTTDIGEVGPDVGFASWQRIGAVFPELLIPPAGGERTYTVVVRTLDANRMPLVTAGFCDGDHPGLLDTQTMDFNYHFEGSGYEEEEEQQEKARALAVKIGIAVAFADGSYDESEGEVVKDFVRRVIAPFSDDKQQRLKGIYNDAIREAYQASNSGNLSLSELTSALRDATEPSGRYEAIALCFDVMAADGVADANELQVIRKVASALELDFDEIERMQDKALIGLNATTEQADIEVLLGIDGAWPPAKIQKHLRGEFQKWNGRLNTLGEGQERDNAQRMLDLIAEARKKYS